MNLTKSLKPLPVNLDDLNLGPLPTTNIEEEATQLELPFMEMGEE